jgi:hypothetical protein
MRRSSTFSSLSNQRAIRKPIDNSSENIMNKASLTFQSAHDRVDVFVERWALCRRLTVALKSVAQCLSSRCLHRRSGRRWLSVNVLLVLTIIALQQNHVVVVVEQLRDSPQALPSVCSLGWDISSHSFSPLIRLGAASLLFRLVATSRSLAHRFFFRFEKARSSMNIWHPPTPSHPVVAPPTQLTQVGSHFKVCICTFPLYYFLLLYPLKASAIVSTFFFAQKKFFFAFLFFLDEKNSHIADKGPIYIYEINL